MESNASLYHRKYKHPQTKKTYELYSFFMSNEYVYNKLLNYGLHPRKSRTVNFPEVPGIYLRHFIRGCWDGDGSFYIEKTTGKIRANFISGSELFINGLVERLHNVGFKKFTIHKTHRSWKTIPKHDSYYITVNTKDCIKLYHYLYNDVPETMYLSRKYDVVKNYLGSTNYFDKNLHG